MANALNLFGNPEFLKDLEFLNDLKSVTDLGQQQTQGQARSDVIELADPFAAHRTGATSADPAHDLVVNEIVEEFRLNQVLEQARLATGATGAAIALVRGKEIVCRATAGPNAPGLGVGLDPRSGLSGLCIQSRQLQHCNDSETDPRVSPEACRSLGVRSIVVLPLMDGDELFGVFEIFSSRPNVFGQSDLHNLEALTDRILESRRQEWEATATLPHKGSGSFLHNLDEVVPEKKSLASESDSRIPPRELASTRNLEAPTDRILKSRRQEWEAAATLPHKGSGSLLHNLEEVVPQDKSHAVESDSSVPRRERAFTRKEIWTPILGVLTLAAAVLFGILVGSRLGRPPEFRGSSPPHRATGASKTGRTDHTVLPAKEQHTESAPAAESGASGAAGPAAKQRIPAGTRGPAQPASDGLPVYQDSPVNIHVPRSSTSPTRDPQASPRSPGLEADSEQR